MENKNLPTVTTQFETQEQIKATSVTWPIDLAQSAPSAEQWRVSNRQYPAHRGTDFLLITPSELDEALEAYAALRTAQLERERNEALELNRTERDATLKHQNFILEITHIWKTRADTAESALARQKQLTIEDIEEMAGYIADTNNELGSKVLKVAAYLVGMKIRVAAQTPEEK